ncbi:MAG: hypothetical protein ACLSCQ_10175 [Evtepia gabavorous]
MDPAVTCCFSGHRPVRLPWGRNEADPRCLALKARLDQALEEAHRQGFRHFLCGMAQEPTCISARRFWTSGSATRRSPLRPPSPLPARPTTGPPPTSAAA